MEELWTLLTSPAWWVTAVVVGLLINLMAAYLKPRLDDGLSRSSSWWKARSEKEKAEAAAKVDMLRRHPERHLQFAMDCLQRTVLAAAMTVIGILLAIPYGLQLKDLIHVALGSVGLFGGFFGLRFAFRDLSLLKEAVYEPQPSDSQKQSIDIEPLRTKVRQFQKEVAREQQRGTTPPRLLEISMQCGSELSSWMQHHVDRPNDQKSLDTNDVVRIGTMGAEFHKRFDHITELEARFAEALKLLDSLEAKYTPRQRNGG